MGSIGLCEKANTEPPARVECAPFSFTTPHTVWGGSCCGGGPRKHHITSENGSHDWPGGKNIRSFLSVDTKRDQMQGFLECRRFIIVTGLFWIMPKKVRVSLTTATRAWSSLHRQCVGTRLSNEKNVYFNVNGMSTFML